MKGVGLHTGQWEDSLLWARSDNTSISIAPLNGYNVCEQVNNRFIYAESVSLLVCSLINHWREGAREKETDKTLAFNEDS